MTKSFVSAMALLAFTGCSKKSETSGTAADPKSADKDHDKPSAGDMPEPLATRMPADADKAWQGAWQGHMSLSTSGEMSTPPVAIEIKDGKAKVFDGRAEKTLDFSVDSPCSAAFKLDTDKGKYTFSKHFAMVGGKLAIGDGPVGTRKGKAAVVCGIKLTTIDDKGTCLDWSHFFDKWESKPAECAWSSEGGKDVLTIGKGDWSTKLVADGDTLMTDQFREESAKQFAPAKDYEAAKAWLATAKK